MRKAFLFLLISVVLSTSFIFPHKRSYAQSQYLRVITEDTPFYSDENGTQLLFYLPYTYYVKVLSQGNGNLFHVECYGENGTPAIDGYVPYTTLYEDGLNVNSPYLNKTITTANTCVLYQDTTLSQSVQFLFKDRQLIYYGSMKAHDNSILFCVSYNGKFGYVKEADILPFTIENHPNELTFLTPESPSQTLPSSPQANLTQTNSFLSLRIIIIACLILAGLLALFVALGKHPQTAKTSFYDENEYE